MGGAYDARDDWYEETGGSAGARDRGVPYRLVSVAPPHLAFELVAPDDFEAAQVIADRLRDGTPVFVDLHGVDPRLAGRLTDFCSGLVYALKGSLQQIGRDALLISPDGSELSGDELSGVREPGFFNRI